MKKLLFLLMVLAITVSVNADVVNRYSFDTDVSDSVGAADGVLVGGAYVSGGILVLPGGAHLAGGHAELPTTILDGLVDVSFEMWFNYQNPTSDWHRVFDFGASIPEGNPGAGEGAGNMMYAPRVQAFGFTTHGLTAADDAIQSTRNEDQARGPRIEAGVDAHVICSFNSVTGEMKIYQDGVLVGTQVTTKQIADLTGTTLGIQEAYLGSPHWPDPDTDGTISEFRVYNSPVGIEQAVLNFQLGDSAIQDSVVTDMAPTNGSTNIITNPTLTWSNDGSVTATSYTVYVSNDISELDPNSTPGAAVTSYVSVEPTQGLTALDNEMEYFWRVDTNTASGTIAGPAFKFTTASAEPIVNSITPAAQVAEATEDITIEVSAISTSTGTDAGLSYEWYLGEDVIVGADSNVLVAPAVAGEYFCQVIDGLASTDSGISIVVNPALKAHWDFDGTVEDIAGDLDGTIVGDVTYAEGKVGVSAAYFNANYVADNNIARDGFIELPSMNLDLRAGTTFSVWANPSNAPSNWQRFFEFGSGAPMDNLSFMRFAGTNEFRFSAANGTNEYAGLNSWPAAGIDNNNWQHLVITVDADRNVEFYKNGVQLDRYVAGNDAAWNIGWSTISQAIPYVERTSNFIGKGNWPDALYSGLMDDLRIYNYALSSDDIQELFLSAQPFICTERPVMDLNDDCKVDFADLAVFAASWLECGRFPADKCID